MKGLALKSLVALLIVSALVLSSAAIPAMAQQDTPDQVTPTSSSSDPEANLPYLFAVYTITWVVFFAYLLHLSQKQRDLRLEIESLRQVIADKGVLDGS